MATNGSLELLNEIREMVKRKDEIPISSAVLLILRSMEHIIERQNIDDIADLARDEKIKALENKNIIMLATKNPKAAIFAGALIMVFANITDWFAIVQNLVKQYLE